MNSRETITIENYEIELSNLSKIFFPNSGLTKRDLVFYYKDIAPYALPYYLNRPLSMLRCPSGIDGQSFMQKEMPEFFPQWMDRYRISKRNGYLNQILVNKQATFVYLANQACITFHLALSQIDKIQYPRFLLFDLDPSSENMDLLKTTVKRVKELTDYLGLESFLQTTGSRGFHIYIPLKRIHTFTKVHDFAKGVATFLSHEYPQEITLEQSKDKRQKRVLIDYARNSYGLHSIGPYSVRNKENAPVATPLYWSEFEDKGLNSQSFTILNIFKRLSHVEDPWKKMVHTEFSLKESIMKLNKLIKAMQ